MSVRRYWAQLIISLRGTVVSSPAQRANCASVPSAARTTSALISTGVPADITFAPRTAPFPMIGAVARVLTKTSAPTSAACQTSSRSKTFRSRT